MIKNPIQLYQEIKKKKRKDSIMSLLSAGGMHITDTKDVF